MPSKRVEFELFKRIKANGNIYIVEMKIFIVILKPKLEVDHAHLRWLSHWECFYLQTHQIGLSEGGFATIVFMANRKEVQSVNRRNLVGIVCC